MISLTICKPFMFTSVFVHIKILNFMCILIILSSRVREQQTERKSEVSEGSRGSVLINLF